MESFNLNPRIALVASVGVALVSGLPVRASELDHRIESAAKNSYNFRVYLRNDNIRVDAEGGVVTLSGAVSSDYHKFLAEVTVSGLPGVKSVTNQLVTAGDLPPEHSDGWITMKVKSSLAFHRSVSAKETEVHTQDGVVTLSGNAESEAQKELTSEYAMDVEGVLGVRNELVVARPAKTHRTLGDKVDDVSITAQVKTALLFHKSTRPLATSVSTRDGVVTLKGEALNAAEKSMVTTVAKNIDGVKQVRNYMNVQKS